MSPQERRELPSERGRRSGLDLDDQVSADDIGDKAVDRNLEEISLFRVSVLQRCVKGSLVQCSDVRGGDAIGRLIARAGGYRTISHVPSRRAAIPRPR